MCNPPFFETMDEAGRNPNTACGGAATEMVCPGGEEAFVKRIFADSLAMKDSIHWFTTMCGKKEHDEEDALVPSHASRPRHPYHGTFARGKRRDGASRGRFQKTPRARR